MKSDKNFHWVFFMVSQILFSKAFFKWQCWASSITSKALWLSASLISSLIKGKIDSIRLCFSSVIGNFGNPFFKSSASKFLLIKIRGLKYLLRKHALYKDVENEKAGDFAMLTCVNPIFCFVRKLNHYLNKQCSNKC